MAKHNEIDHTGITGVGGSVATDTIFDAKGDLVAATGANAAARLPVGTNGHVLTADSAEATGVKWAAAAGGSSSLTSADATLGADVTMATANTYYDGPSTSLAAGTWLIIYKGVFTLATTSQTHDVTMKLWDGTTVYDETPAGLPVANSSGTISYQGTGFAIVVLGSTTTVKMSASDIRANSVMKRNVSSNGASSNTATRLSAVKIA